MKLNYRIVLSTLLAAAGILLADTIGWHVWKAVSDTCRQDPAKGADRLASDPLVALPPVTQRSRRLVAGDLSGAPAATLAAGLRRLAGLQKLWMGSHPDGFRNDARVAFLEGRLEDGLGELELALERDPMSPDLHLLIAAMLRRLGRQEASLNQLAEAEALAPARHPSVVEVTAEEQRWVRLEGLHRRLDRYPRQRMAILLELARELRQRGRDWEARSVLEDELPHPEAAIELSRWDVDGGRYSAALARLRTVVERTALPSSIRVRAWALMAEARDLSGDPEGAVAAAREALRLEPTSTAPYLALAGLAERRGDSGKALVHLRRAWGVAPTDVALLVRIAATAESAGSPGDARLALERAAEIAPERPELRALLVEHHLRQGRLVEAMLTLTSALDRFPTDSRLLQLADRLAREVAEDR